MASVMAPPADVPKIAMNFGAANFTASVHTAMASSMAAGYKQSGKGREMGVFGLEEYLEVKALIGFIKPVPAETLRDKRAQTHGWQSTTGSANQKGFGVSMRILVTGGTGFLGGYAMAALKATPRLKLPISSARSCRALTSRSARR